MTKIKKTTATKKTGAKPSVKKTATKKVASSKTRTKTAGKAVRAELVESDEDESGGFGESSESEVRDGLDVRSIELPPQDLPAEIDPDLDIDEEEFIGRSPRSAKPVVVEQTLFDRPVPERADKDDKAVATTDPISLYLAEIRKYPLLSKDDEQRLAIRYREHHDPKAAELLVTSNLRFVVKVAAEYSRFGAKLIDLIQEGNVGLMHAVREFNPYKGVRLITYAVWWIRGYIQEYMMRQYSMVRIGTTQNQRKLFYRLQKERQAMGSRGEEATTALLAGRLGVTEAEVETMTKRLSGRDLSLNAPVDASGNTSASLLDFEPSLEERADEQLGHLEEMEVLQNNLDEIRPNLTEKETYILQKRILADDPLTLQEIGDHYGVTREAVRQLEARLINRIRLAVTRSLNASTLNTDVPAASSNKVTGIIDQD